MYAPLYVYRTAYGIGDSKFRKILEMTFPTPPGHHRLPIGQGFAAQRIRFIASSLRDRL